MRWLLVKDLQILRRSPLQAGVLVVYPIAIALMIGFALSSPPGRPTVAIYSGIPTSKVIHLGSTRVDVGSLAEQLFTSVRPLREPSPEAAIAQVRDGHALAALIIPDDLTSEIESLVTSGTGTPTVQVVLNGSNPLERQFAEQALQSRIAQAEQALSKLVLKVALGDLQVVLGGGSVNLLNRQIPLLGLQRSRTILGAQIATHPGDAALRRALGQVVNFANLAIDGLTFAGPVLGSIGTPVTVQQTVVAGRSTPTDSYAVAIAAVVSLMFVALLLAAGLLALEGSEHAYPRLVRGLVAPEALLAEKILLASACAAAVTLVMAAIVSSFVSLDWGRFELWVVSIALAGLAFGSLGVALGGLAREVAGASLLAFLCSLPVAFVALVPSTSVSGGVEDVLKVVSFVFPFKAGLDAVSNAFSGTPTGIVLPLLHLVVLTVVYAAGARLALRRFAAA